jgi:hypothetical protein
MLPPAKGALVNWEPRGNDVGQHNEVGVCLMCASVVVESGHQCRMHGRSLPPKIDVPRYQR